MSNFLGAQRQFSGKTITHEEFKRKMKSILDKQFELLIEKNGKYAKREDALSNFRFQSLTCLIGRTNDKMNRLISMHEAGRFDEASFRDAFMDIANYGMLALCVYDEIMGLMEQSPKECPMPSKK